MRRAPWRLAFLLLVLATVGIVLQAASLPHLHAGNQAGLYNEEHDLTLLAGLAGHVLLAGVTPALVVALIATLLQRHVAERPPLRLRHAADSRAPPVR